LAPLATNQQYKIQKNKGNTDSVSLSQDLVVFEKTESVRTVHKCILQSSP